MSVYVYECMYSQDPIICASGDNLYLPENWSAFICVIWNYGYVMMTGAYMMFGKGDIGLFVFTYRT